MHNISEIVEDFKLGKMVILVDDEDRENEGDLILAADFVTPALINFMAKEARGLICLTLTSDKIKQLGLPLMVSDHSNLSPNGTAFTISIEASTGITTGISAADRSHTVKVAANPNAKASDIIMPGHIFPIRAQDGGVLKRAGHTEASVDLSRLAGLTPAAVICEIMNEDGTMARVPELKEFAKLHDIKMGTIADLIEYRIQNESFLEIVKKEPYSSELCEDFELYTFVDTLNNKSHYAFVKGNPLESKITTVRVQKQNVLDDVFSEPAKKECKINTALELLNQSECGVFVYITNDDSNPDLSKADMEKRDYGVGAQILRSLGVKDIRLITSKPESKLVGLNGFGLTITETMSLSKQGAIRKVTKNFNMDEKVVH